MSKMSEDSCTQIPWWPKVAEPKPEPPAETFFSKLKSLMIASPSARSKRLRIRRPYQYGCCFIALWMIFGFSTVGCIIMWFTDLYLDSILNQMTLRKDTEIYKAWKDPPVRPLICVHIYNYTNIDDYMAGRSKTIKVNDTGPYCYRETLQKIDVQFYDNGTVSYGDRRTHKFEKVNSTGSMTDTLIVPNLPLISTWAMVRNENLLTQFIIKQAIQHVFEQTTMIKVKAHEFLFGYNDTLLYFIANTAKFFSKIDAFKSTIKNYLKTDIPFEKFGILAMRAMETNERITTNSGSIDLNSIGVVTALNGQDKMTAWDKPECNRLDGSDGAFFPRQNINTSARLYLFHKDLCRKLPLDYQKDVDFQDGVMGMRFHVPPDVYNTTGTCYCKNNVCPPVGVFDVSPCANGAPVMMSFPHFMNADPSVTAHLEGLHPNPEKHDFFIDINPVLGFTLGTVSRLQLNIQIKKSHMISNFEEFSDDTILPVAWFEVTADRLPPDLFKMIYHASVTVQWIQWSLQWGFLAALVTSAVAILICRKYNMKQPVYSAAAPHARSLVSTV